MSKPETITCHQCGQEEIADLIDTRDSGDGDYTMCLCVRCYGTRWHPLNETAIARSVRPDLRGFYLMYLAAQQQWNDRRLDNHNPWPNEDEVVARLSERPDVKPMPVKPEGTTMYVVMVEMEVTKNVKQFVAARSPRDAYKAVAARWRLEPTFEAVVGPQIEMLGYDVLNGPDYTVYDEAMKKELYHIDADEA